MKITTECLNVYNYLSSIHKQIETFTVTEDFIAFRNKMKDKFQAGKRDETTRLMHADCLCVEYALLEKNLVQPPESIHHDFIYEDSKVDCKLINTRYFSVPGHKVLYYMENLRKRRLTDFAFYKYKKNPDAPLKVGDVVEFKLISVVPAYEVMEDLVPSQYRRDDYYYTVG